MTSENAQQDRQEVSHGELVQRISEMFEQMSGEDLAEVWNMKLCPFDPVKYIGDGQYEWIDEDVSG